MLVIYRIFLASRGNKGLFTAKTTYRNTHIGRKERLYEGILVSLRMRPPHSRAYPYSQPQDYRPAQVITSNELRKEAHKILFTASKAAHDSSYGMSIK